MPREKHRHKKRHRGDATDENENKNERPRSNLFSEADLKSVEISGYTADRGALQNNRLIQEHSIPVGVVGIDESVQLPISSPSKSHDSKSYTTLRPSENYRNGHVHLPPISHHPYQHLPNEYYRPSPDYPYFGNYSHPYPVYPEHHSSHHHHHQHHHPHHRHRHHEQKKEVETYDPRWWYMPVNSVHTPISKRPPEYHYTPPKWYELSRGQSRTSLTTHETKLSPQKYVRCRCEVCSPSKETPRGTRWVVND